MYRDLGFLRVWGSQADGPDEIGGTGGAAYAYLIYPHRPIVAYLAQTHRLLGEYCVEFLDDTRPYGSARLPDSDDVLAKWMALTGDERRLISTANMHLPGRQLDPAQVGRDLWRLAVGARPDAREAATRAPFPPVALPGQSSRNNRSRYSSRRHGPLRWIPSIAAARSPKAPLARPRAPSSRGSATTPRR